MTPRFVCRACSTAVQSRQNAGRANVNGSPKPTHAAFPCLSRRASKRHFWTRENSGLSWECCAIVTALVLPTDVGMTAKISNDPAHASRCESVSLN